MSRAVAVPSAPFLCFLFPFPFLPFPLFLNFEVAPQIKLRDLGERFPSGRKWHFSATIDVLWSLNTPKMRLIAAKRRPISVKRSLKIEADEVISEYTCHCVNHLLNSV